MRELAADRHSLGAPEQKKRGVLVDPLLLSCWVSPVVGNLASGKGSAIGYLVSRKDFAVGCLITQTKNSAVGCTLSRKKGSAASRVAPKDWEPQNRERSKAARGSPE